MTDLKDLTAYWNRKYPSVTVRLWDNPSANQFLGQMISYKETFILNAKTMGDLISQGEAFLRRAR